MHGNEKIWYLVKRLVKFLTLGRNFKFKSFLMPDMTRTRGVGLDIDRCIIVFINTVKYLQHAYKFFA